MTYPRAILLLAVVAIGMFTFLPLLAIGGLGDIGDSNGYQPPNASASAGAGGSATATGSGTATGNGTPAGSPSANNGSTTSTTTPAAGGAQVTVTSTKIAFDKTKITVAAGPVTITYDNKDSGVPHNFHVFQGNDNSGKSLGQTDIKAGPNTQTLNVTLKAGTYYYQCDVHPQQMNGTITAK